MPQHRPFFTALLLTVPAFVLLSLAEAALHPDPGGAWLIAAAWAGDDDGDSDSDSDDGDDRDDDDSDDDRDDDSDDRNMPANLPQRTIGSDGRERVRQHEISAARLRAADLQLLKRRGFRVIRSQASSSGIAARLAPPAGMADRAALKAASAAVPGAVFDLSHVYSPGGKVYGRTVAGMPATDSCLSGARIGIIDTAIADHAALRGARVRRKTFSASARPAAHGTAVASIIAGATPAGGQLVAKAELYAAAVFQGAGGQPITDAMDLVAALDWMTDNRVPVVNMSIAGPPNALLADAVARSAQAGTILVAAAGNGGRQGGPRYPAAYPSVVAVTAVDRHGRLYARASRGDYIDIAAPGVDVWGADLTAPQGARWSGTSFATPFVTVEIAAARKAGKVRDATTARAWLARSAIDLGAPGRDRLFGAGLMQAAACK